jgi:hypothetical protein
MPATVQQGSNLAVICADNDNRGASQPSGDIITRRGNFAFVTEVNPAAIEYLVEFSAVDIVAGKGFASDKSVFGVNEATGWRWTHDQTCLSLSIVHAASRNPRSYLGRLDRAIDVTSY